MKRTLSLEFAAVVDDTTRRRISYAFRVFCAVYGHGVGTEVDRSGGVRLHYGSGPSSDSELGLPAGYRARERTVPAPAPTLLPSGEAKLSCFHPANGRPDWLAEIFEWLSSADEHSIQDRDAVGRIPLAATLHGRHDLDPCIPYAALAMQRLNDEIRRHVGDGWSLAPEKPWAADHRRVIAATHDIDFLPLSRWEMAKRAAKNVAIAALLFRDPRLALSVARTGLGAVLRDRSGLGYYPAMLQEEERRGIASTFTVLCRKEHRRDANYDVDDPRVRRFLNFLSQAGVELGVHGSYTSLSASGRLAEEYARLAASGFPAVGGRQHWLRYNDATLFEEMSHIGCWYDCTVGYNWPGFRSGACFPYPPYDFSTESPFPILELPLVLMDVTLYGYSRDASKQREISERVLNAVREYGWGGVSILWHDTVVQGVQLPREVGDLYWKLKAPDERWLGARELVEQIWPRYAAAGLLPATPPGPR